MQIPSQILEAKARHEARAIHYREELARHVHNPYARALVEAAYLDTDELQAIIHRHGLPHYERHLATLRAHLQQRRADLAEATELQLETRRLVIRLRNRQASHKTTPPMHRNLVTRRLEVTTATIAKTDADLAKAQNWVGKADELYSKSREQVENLAILEKRLAAAVTAYVLREEPAVVVAPPPAPVVNVQVNVPDELKIAAMPTRTTTSTVSRDGAGNIVSTTQVEIDA